MRVPSWLITVVSLVAFTLLWEWLCRGVNPVFGSYPSAIMAEFWKMMVSGELGTAVLKSIQPFLAGFLLAIVIGVPLGLVIGRFRIVRAALGVLVTAGYAMPLIAFVPLVTSLTTVMRFSPACPEWSP